MGLSRSPRTVVATATPAFLGLLLAYLSVSGAACTSRPPAPGPAGLSVTGPHVAGNLAVYLVRGPDTLHGRTLLALDEALRTGKVVVRETSEVNRLSIENVSAEPVFLEAGQIVRGGRQDRALSVDLVVPPHSGALPIDAFCVEHGRWSRRGDEPEDRFSRSVASMSSREMKLAARKSKVQEEVWTAVAKEQQKLSRAAGADARDPRSPSSMGLTLEGRAVTSRTEPYVHALEAAPAHAGDVVGCVFAIDGRLETAEIYGSPALFRDAWRRVLEAAAASAVSASAESATAGPLPTLVEAQRFLDDSLVGRRSVESVAGRMNLVTIDGPQVVSFESHETTGTHADKDAWLRRSVVRK